MESSFSEIPQDKILDNIYVASPCSADWETMTGNDRVRFCGQCRLNVYNLSDMTRQEATDLIVEREGKLCVKYYTREDGTIITQNCPVGLRKLRDHVYRAAAIISGIVCFILSIGSAFAQGQKSDPKPCANEQSPAGPRMYHRGFVGDLGINYWKKETPKTPPVPPPKLETFETTSTPEANPKANTPQR
jgi:hypothetical protein